MMCSDPRRSDETRVKAALEEMDDNAVAMLALILEEMAKKFPRKPQAKLMLVADADQPKSAI